MFHKVIQVIPTPDYKVYLYFDDGRIKLFDASDIIQQGIFRQIADRNIFMERCTVLNHTLAWDIEGRYDESASLDMDPETLYETCPETKEPLIKTA